MSMVCPLPMGSWTLQKARRSRRNWGSTLLCAALLGCAARTPRPAAEGAASATEAHGIACPHDNPWWLEPRNKLELKLEGVSVAAFQGDVLAWGHPTGAVWLRERGTRITPAVLDGGMFWGLSEPLSAGWLLAKREGTLLAWDAATAKPAWQLPLGADAGITEVARARDVALVSTRNRWNEDRSKMRSELLGIEPKSAKVRWRIVSPNPNDAYPKVVATTDTFAVTSEVAGEPLVQGLDATTGKVLWQTPVRSVQRLLSDADHVVVISDAMSGLKVQTRAARTGAVVAESHVPGQFRQQALLDAGVLYIHGASLTARRVRSHEVLWDHAFPFDFSHAPSPSVFPLQSVEGAVVLCERGTLRALDQKTGAELWSYGLDLLPCGSFAVAAGPRIYVARTRDMTDQSNGDDSVVEFLPSPLPAETATVRGHVSSFDLIGYGSISPAGSDVLVGDTVARVQPDGSYEAHVTTRGTLRVFVHVGLPNDMEEEKCDPGAQASAEFPLKNATNYSADLTLERRCW